MLQLLRLDHGIAHNRSALRSVIRLISQFLKENNLSNTLRALQVREPAECCMRCVVQFAFVEQEESQITMNTVDNVDKFVLDIQQGRTSIMRPLGRLRCAHVLSQVGTLSSKPRRRCGCPPTSWLTSSSRYLQRVSCVAACATWRQQCCMDRFRSFWSSPR